MPKQKCGECGNLLVASEYGVLYCPHCQDLFRERFKEMVEETKGGYY